MTYVIKKIFQKEFSIIVEQLKALLADEGFGILTQINVQETLKNKLGQDIEPYIILGVCNPQFASKALQEEQDIGVLLPCNLVIYEKDDSVVVSAIKPTSAMNMISNTVVQDIAQQVEERLAKVLDRLKEE